MSISGEAVRMEGDRPAETPAPRFTGDPEMKQYLLSVRITEQDGEYPTEDLQPTYNAVDTLNKEMQATGAWVFAGGLHPSRTATVLRVKDGEVLTTDGPYAEGKEQVGG